MLISLLVMAAGLVVLVGGAELLVRGAARLAAAFGISALVIGLTVVAFGTSAPELAVSVQSALAGQPDLAVGNVVGSNIFNVLFILGLSALITPLVVSIQLVRLDVPIMVGVTLLVAALAWDGAIGRAEGVLLVGGIIAYTVLLIRLARRAGAGSAAAGTAGTAGVALSTASPDDPPAVPAPSPRLAVNLLLAAVGLVLLVVGARWLVRGAVEIATSLGVSELVVGLTIVAAGTSLPEVATSIVAAVRGERDIAVGNVVGSNIFNLLAVLGLTAVVAPGGIVVAPAVLAFDVPVMVAVAVACLPIFFTGHLIARWEGALFFGLYLGYLAYVVLAATGHAALPAFASAMTWVVLPLVALTLAIALTREARARLRGP